jgi:hypothetical protein
MSGVTVARLVSWRPEELRDLAGSSGHSAYYDPGSESLRNIALAGLARDDLITTGGPGGSVAGAVKVVQQLNPFLWPLGEGARRLP